MLQIWRASKRRIILFAGKRESPFYIFWQHQLWFTSSKVLLTCCKGRLCTAIVRWEFGWLCSSEARPSWNGCLLSNSGNTVDRHFSCHLNTYFRLGIYVSRSGFNSQISLPGRLSRLFWFSKSYGQGRLIRFTSSVSVKRILVLVLLAVWFLKSSCPRLQVLLAVCSSAGAVRVDERQKGILFVRHINWIIR